jgi:ubiquinone/menaquinone biosynthesis C-methylase UbiE
MNEANRQKKERSIWSRQASAYDARVFRIYREAYQLSVEKACAVLSSDNRVVEIGCGTGIITLGVAACVGRVIGTDVSPEMIEVARRKAEEREVENVDFRVSDGYALPYDDASFDAVLMFNTLHVVKEPEALLREAHRLLRPSGYLVSATDCYAEPVPLAIRLKLLVQGLLKALGVIPFLSSFTVEDLRRLFESASFEVMETDVLHPAPVNAYVLGRKA